MSRTDTDRIEKTILLRASRPRVWRALTDVKEFNRWFQAALEGAFSPGARLRGPITSEGYEDLVMEMTVERMQPERLISWRWHPGSADRSYDYSREPETVVTFELQDAEGGTLLRVTETGFDALPPERWEEAYRGNEAGWAEQLTNIEKHLEAVP